MEWVLQLVDEIDDVCAAWRQWWLRAAPEMELLLVGCWGVVVFAMTSLWGAKSMTLAASAVALSSRVAFSVQRRFTGYNSR
ncbi:MAG: hypothetical protein ABSF94_12425 [Steroidobacteraceae bacterium]|jgi:hypothetical protein